MSISEDQFKQMLKGTVHEGKYQKDKPEPAPVQEQEKPVRVDNGMKQTERASDVFMQVLPYAVAIRLLTNPGTYIVLILLLIFFSPVIVFIVDHWYLLPIIPCLVYFALKENGKLPSQKKRK